MLVMDFIRRNHTQRMISEERLPFPEPHPLLPKTFICRISGREKKSGSAFGRAVSVFGGGVVEKVKAGRGFSSRPGSQQGKNRSRTLGKGTSGAGFWLSGALAVTRRFSIHTMPYQRSNL